MGLVKRPNSKFWYIQFVINGETYLKSSRTSNKQLASKIERKWYNEIIENQEFNIQEEISIAAALDQYLKLKIGTGSYINNSAQVKYIKANMDCSRLLSSLTSADCEWLKQKRAESSAEQTVKHTLNVLRCTWKNSKSLGYHVSDIGFPKIKVTNGKTRYMTDTEVQRLFDELNPFREGHGLAPYQQRSNHMKRMMWDNHDLVKLIAFTGARHKEIAHLKWNQVDLSSKTINLYRPKVKNESIIHMTDEVFEILTQREKHKTTDYVFTNRKGDGPRNYSAIAITKIFRRAGLTDCGLHTLRHTLASKMVKNGFSLYEVQSILGHTSPTTTTRYSHLESASVSKKVAEKLFTK
jgi:integrase